MGTRFGLPFVTALFAITSAAAQEYQIIEWLRPEPGSVLVIGREYPLAAKATSDLPVDFRVESGPAVIQGNTVAATALGLIRLTATQTGNAQWQPAQLTVEFNKSQFLEIESGQWPAFNRGRVLSHTVVGNLAYVGLSANNGLAVLDVSDSTNPIMIGGLKTTNVLASVQVRGNYAFAASADKGLIVFDISDPTQPRFVKAATVAATATARNVQLSGNYAYLSDNWGLTIFDITDPENPIRRGRFANDYPVRATKILGDIAYVANGVNGLAAVNIADPNNPRLVGRIDAAGEALSVDVSGNIAFVAADTGGLRMFDVSNPASIQPLGIAAPQSVRARAVQVLGARAYVVDYFAGLRIYDVSDPMNPAPREELSTQGYLENVQVIGGLAYVSGFQPGLQILRLGADDQASLIGESRLSGSSSAVRANGAHAFVADGIGGLRIFDVSDPTHPTPISAYLSGGFATANDVELRPGLAFLAQGDTTETFVVLDISNPANPTRLRALDVGAIADIELDGNYAYLAAGLDGYRIIDISNAANPRVVASQSAPMITDFKKVGDILYAIGAGSIHAINVANPSSPALLDTNTRGASYSDIAIVGNRAILSGDVGLHFVDITDPTNMIDAGGSSVDADGDVTTLNLVGQNLYIGNGRSLDILDFSGNVPVLLGQFQTRNFIRDLDIVGDLVYIADAQGGLVVERLREGFHQSVSFPALGRYFAGVPLVLDAQSESGLPVQAQVIAGPATISNGRLNFTAPGAATVRYSVAGNTQFFPETYDQSYTALALPSLTFELAGQTLFVRWPADYDDFVLDEASELPATEWRPNNDGINPQPGLREIATPATAGPRFFRLRLPAP